MQKGVRRYKGALKWIPALFAFAMEEVMRVGVPREIKDHEYRVGLTPDGARALHQAGHEVLVETSAGEGSGYPDEDYRQAGASILQSAAEIFERAGLIIKVKEPLQSECRLLRAGHILFTYLHLASSAELTKKLMESRVMAIA